MILYQLLVAISALNREFNWYESAETIHFSLTKSCYHVNKKSLKKQNVFERIVFSNLL